MSGEGLWVGMAVAPKHTAADNLGVVSFHSFTLSLTFESAIQLQREVGEGETDSKPMVVPWFRAGDFAVGSEL